jgi:hypothetical protein
LDALKRTWVRRLEALQGVSVWWWGALGDGLKDDILAFEAANNYCTLPFGAGSLMERLWKPKIVVPYGFYKISRQWAIGGAPINATDAIKYSWYNKEEAASYNLGGHLAVASTLPISIECDQRAYIFGDFKPTELTAIVSYGSDGWQYGGWDMQNPTITGLKICGYNGMEMNLHGRNTKQAGLIMYGGRNTQMSGCGFYNLEVGLVQNCTYFANLQQMQFKNCGLGFFSVGSHSTTGWMFHADHCDVAYEIKSGASTYKQLSTENCGKALIVGGGFNHFDGLYFETGWQNTDTYQLTIGYHDGSFPVMGTTVTAATITSPLGILMDETANGLTLTGCNFVSSALKTTSPYNIVWVVNCYADIQGDQKGSIIYPFAYPAPFRN